MLRNDNPISFIATVNPAEALTFYRDKLGLQLIADEPFALVFDLNGHMLRIAKAHALNPAKHTVFGWDVSDIEARIRELAAQGIAFQRFPGMAQDALGIWVSPSGAKVAWFKDPDGNNLSLTQFK